MFYLDFSEQKFYWRMRNLHTQRFITFVDFVTVVNSDKILNTPTNDCLRVKTLLKTKN